MPSYAPAFVRPTDAQESPNSVGVPEQADDFLADESALNEECCVGVVATPPIGKKAFTREEIDQLVLARPDREALANTRIEFATKFGFVAGKGRNTLWKRAEARESAGAKKHSRQQER
jgi:hypothetical protein